MSHQPITITVPNRKPFVRCPTFIDGLGPPPFDFFDETQDHLAAYFHAQTGWQWSAQSTDFEEFNAATIQLPPFHLRYSNCTIAAGAPTPVNVTTAQGDHACIKIGNDARPWYLRAATAQMVLGGDFLISAKVRLDGIAHFDAGEGLFVGLDLGVGDDGTVGRGYPYGFTVSGNKTTWTVGAPTIGLNYDTGRPASDGRWYVMQISRQSGGMRFFIDNRLIKIPDANGVLREGVYVPQALTTRRAFRVWRTTPGLTTDMFYIDYFHRFCQR